MNVHRTPGPLIIELLDGSVSSGATQPLALEFSCIDRGSEDADSDATQQIREMVTAEEYPATDTDDPADLDSRKSGDTRTTLSVNWKKVVLVAGGIVAGALLLRHLMRSRSMKMETVKMLMEPMLGIKGTYGLR